ncbi:MAG: hypothetical protein M3Z32_08340 [Acidobacteriota bacterium]|nr:hypothetical protein [Acidobacteriota bacterium]
MLVTIFGILKTRTPYYELGADYYDQLNPEKTIQKLVRRLGKLGVDIVVIAKDAKAKLIGKYSTRSERFLRTDESAFRARR